MPTVREADEASRLRAARDWFTKRGQSPFEFQEQVWRALWRGESGLLNADTGTGKTLAAWLGPVLEAREGDLPGVKVLWITPLRALARDLVGALRRPAKELGIDWKIEQRTGDTSSALRAKQNARPPETLITTPESLSLLLSYASWAPALRTVTTVVVDEWHEFLGTKRGVQLELALSRLRSLAPSLRVWGLSATLPDLDDAMRTLLGPGRDGRLVRAPRSKHYEIESSLPESITRFPWAGHLGMQQLPDVLQRVDSARTTLIFTNTRSQAELWYQAIVSTRLDLLTVTALHHGSIDAKIRRRIEDSLKSGALRCVVCTSSLDLGVDFPPVDQVMQIGSPKSVVRLLQRAGRSGHRPGETSRVVVVPTHAWELVECAAARHAVETLALEHRRGLTLSLDVLAQHLVTLAVGEGFDADDVLREVRTSHAFADLSEAQWEWTLDFITRGGSALQGYPQFRRVVRDLGRFVIGGADLARRHRRSVGTITSDAAMLVKWASGGVLGTVEESFIGRLRPRDAFVFGGRVLQLVRVKDSTAYVRLSRAKSKFVPRWQGARLPLSVSLGRAVLELFDMRERGLARDIPEMRVAEPLLSLQSELSALPSRHNVLVELHRSREGFHVFVFPFAGRLLNEGMATLISLRAARETPRTFSVTTNEYGFELLCAEPFEIDEVELARWASPDGLLEDLLASVNASELAKRQFRDIARIAGLIDPGMPGRAKSGRQLQASSGLLFEVLERHDPASLLLDQAKREVLTSQLAYRDLLTELDRLAALPWNIQTPKRFTPLSFPLWADRLQTQTLSTETWQTRILREARRLERASA